MLIRDIAIEPRQIKAARTDCCLESEDITHGDRAATDCYFISIRMESEGNHLVVLIDCLHSVITVRTRISESREIRTRVGHVSPIDCSYLESGTTTLDSLSVRVRCRSCLELHSTDVLSEPIV